MYIIDQTLKRVQNLTTLGSAVPVIEYLIALLLLQTTDRK